MNEYIILKRLKKHAGKIKSFHMPGHKGRGDFKLKFPVADLDVTELSWSDNLACPSGVIAQAQRDVAAILGATKSYFTTDGSSSGVYALTYAASLRGKKIIVFRNSHKSVWNACRILGVEPLVVQGEEREGILLPPEPEKIEELFSKDGNISALFATSPDYYGNIAPLAEYAAITKKYDRLLLVDGAHGAHLAFGAQREGYAGVYADAWVDGAHKTLPTLTQGAIVNVAEPSLISSVEEGLEIFRTTSPSYPVMASIEYGVKYLNKYPKTADRAKRSAAYLKKSLYGRIPLYENDDWAKIVVDFKPLGISCAKAQAKLEKSGVYAELCDGRYLIFYLSPMNDKSDVKLLKRRLLSVAANRKLKGPCIEREPVPAAQRTFSYLYAFKKPSEEVELSRAVGRMSATNAGIAPPCIPVIVAGEIITEAAVRALLSAPSTFGVKDGKIRVVRL